MANRDTPNSYFAWYNDDDRLAIVVKQSSSSSDDGTTAGEYDTYLDSTVSNGIKMTIHSKYETATNLSDDLETTCGLDDAMHSYVLDYVKSRILEDAGQMQPSQYFRTKFEHGVSKKPTRKSGVRSLSVPKI
tara:strand:- start:405 stop:800 length:396 start_codon:yes stop_codon:yes gene_type:complete